ncbi:GDSL-type esterase/lipase family protein [Microbacterium sp. DT81.1]|uniref:GDSL-type esterase/lipase family protein n=1 Tax=Microbacterium sp. DT81.1 TaxID=3393413 RepID=UPI003CF454F8
MVALGDSISRAGAADGTSGDNLPNSWSTGTAVDVMSHRARIADLFGAAPTAHNLARGGTETSDLPRQASNAVSESADYVTMLSGGNNICHASSVTELPAASSVGADYAAALKIINAGLPNAEVLVSSIPSMMSLYLAGRDSWMARVVWAAVGVCPVMLADPLDLSGTAHGRRATVESRVDALNLAIEEACAAALNCTYDDGAVNDMTVIFSDLSTRDYFHPSVAGQAKIAAQTWGKVIEKGTFNSAPTALPGAPMTTVVDETSSRIEWTGSWATSAHPSDNGGSVRYPRIADSGYSLRFNGTRISIEARRTPSSGISEVRIDGVLVGRIDGYSASREYRQLVFVSRGLPAGPHTVTVSATSEKNPDSTGRNSIVDALIVESSS